MRLQWEDRAGKDYLYWQTQDRKTLKEEIEVMEAIIFGAGNDGKVLKKGLEKYYDMA